MLPVRADFQVPVICLPLVVVGTVVQKIIGLVLRFFEWLPYVICLPFTGNPLRNLTAPERVTLDRDQAIHTIETLNPYLFVVNPSILTFSPDSLYRQLSSYKTLDFTDLYSFEGEVLVTPAEQENFERILGEANFLCASISPQSHITRSSLSKLLHALEQLQQRALHGTPEQKRHFKDLIRSTIRELGGHHNCADQTLVRIETTLMNVSAELVGVNQFAVLAGLALLQYETDLFSDIILRQNPQEPHQADLQRELFKLFNRDHGNQLRSRNLSSLLPNHWHNLQHLYQNALRQFRQEYNPLEFLLTAPSTYHAPSASTRELFTNIGQWFQNTFGENAFDNLPLALALMPQEHRQHYTAESDFFSDNGRFNKAAMTFCLHHTGILFPLFLPR